MPSLTAFSPTRPWTSTGTCFRLRARMSSAWARTNPPREPGRVKPPPRLGQLSARCPAFVQLPQNVRGKAISSTSSKRRPEHRALKRVGNASLRGIDIKCAEENGVQCGRHDCQPDLEKSRDCNSNRNRDSAADQEPQAGWDERENCQEEDEEPDSLIAHEGFAPGPAQNGHR